MLVFVVPLSLIYWRETCFPTNYSKSLWQYYLCGLQILGFSNIWTGGQSLTGVRHGSLDCSLHWSSVSSDHVQYFMPRECLYSPELWFLYILRKFVIFSSALKMVPSLYHLSSIRSLVDEDMANLIPSWLYVFIMNSWFCRNREKMKYFSGPWQAFANPLQELLSTVFTRYKALVIIAPRG